MIVEKQVLTHLEKCYSLAALTLRGEKKYLVASEKKFDCLLLSEDGAVEQTVWREPGGVMTLEPLSDGAFLATQEFYSPNDSAAARIVLARAGADGWQVRTVTELPFVHRFGVLNREGRRYLVACTLKSAHAFKEDWTCPGRIWVGELTGDGDALTLSDLRPLCSGLLKNHGFFKSPDGYALVGTENGVYRVAPPSVGRDWACDRILDVPASDMLEADFDGDGERELMVLAPFHGDTLTVYKRWDGAYRPVYVFDRPLPFLHALGVCRFGGREVAVVGNRQGGRELLLLQYDGGYRYDVIDRDAGSANVLCEQTPEGMRVLSANREINEVALYTLRP